MKNVHIINSEVINLDTIRNIIENNLKLELSQDSISRINDCRNFLDQKLANSEDLFYGINTGFGSLCNIRISKKELTDLQHNLVKSHSSGAGDEVPSEIVRLMLFLKIQSLSYGYSAIHIDTINRLIDFYNHDALPIVYQLGSLGASGDLAPLAHLSLPLIGEGDLVLKGERMDTSKVYKKMGWKPLKLHSKEGLALLNGTQFSQAYGIWNLLRTEKLVEQAGLISAMSVDAFDCSLTPYDERLHVIRPHLGQLSVASQMLNYLNDSEISSRTKENVQDPYAFRCIPQVHGASLDAIDFVKRAFETEINSVTDNPNIFPDDDVILSGGNFHAQPLALPLDFLAIALAELGNLSERRVFQLMSGLRGLPSFLVANPGLHSGMMIAQYTAAAIVSQNKQFCTPASVDSIVSCNGQEDHVSMAANAATKVHKVVDNIERLMAIEFMVAAQALEFRKPLKTSPNIAEIIINYRKIVPELKEDRVLSIDIKRTQLFLSKLIL